MAFRARTLSGRRTDSGHDVGQSGMRLARQRRPGRIAAGVALAALAVLGFVYLLRVAGHRQVVVRMVRDVPVGRQISRADVGLTSVAVDAGVVTVPAGHLGEVVGQRAAVDLRNGTLVSPAQVTTRLTPSPGEALVTVAMKSGQLPPDGLAPGSRVRIVSAPGQDVGASAGRPVGDVPATVDAVGDADTEGTVPVSLLVADGAASGVARQAAQGQIMLVVTARGG